MSLYEQTLNKLVQATGDGKAYRDDPRKLISRLKPNEVYAVRANDDPRYFHTIMIKKNQVNNAFQNQVGEEGQETEGLRRNLLAGTGMMGPLDLQR